VTKHPNFRRDTPDQAAPSANEDVARLFARVDEQKDAIFRDLAKLYERSPSNFENIATAISIRIQAIRGRHEERPKENETATQSQNVFKLGPVYELKLRSEFKHDKLRSSSLTRFLILQILQTSTSPQSNTSLYQAVLKSGLINPNRASFNARLHRMKSATPNLIKWAEARAQRIEITPDGRLELHRLVQSILRQEELSELERHVPEAFPHRA
jgi:hypothetical protein